MLIEVIQNPNNFSFVGGWGTTVGRHASANSTALVIRELGRLDLLVATLQCSRNDLYILAVGTFGYISKPLPSLYFGFATNVFM